MKAMLSLSQLAKTLGITYYCLYSLFNKIYIRANFCLEVWGWRGERRVGGKYRGRGQGGDK
jgi:hypothetical protein